MAASGVVGRIILKWMLQYGRMLIEFILSEHRPMEGSCEGKNQSSNSIRGRKLFWTEGVLPFQEKHLFHRANLMHQTNLLLVQRNHPQTNHCHVLSAKIQTLPNWRNSQRSGRCSPGRNWVSRYVYTRESMKSKTMKTQDTGTWSAAAWLPLRLCYRPTVFFHHLRLTVLPFPQKKKNRRALKYCYVITFTFCKLRKSVSTNGLHYLTATNRVGPLVCLRYSLTFLRA